MEIRTRPRLFSIEGKGTCGRLEGRLKFETGLEAAIRRSTCFALAKVWRSSQANFTRANLRSENLPFPATPWTVSPRLPFALFPPPFSSTFFLFLSPFPFLFPFLYLFPLPTLYLSFLVPARVYEKLRKREGNPTV